MLAESGGRAHFLAPKALRSNRLKMEFPPARRPVLPATAYRLIGIASGRVVFDGAATDAAALSPTAARADDGKTRPERVVSRVVAPAKPQKSDRARVPRLRIIGAADIGIEQHRDRAQERPPLLGDRYAPTVPRRELVLDEASEPRVRLHQ